MRKILRGTYFDEEISTKYNISIKKFMNGSIKIRKYNTYLRKKKNGWESVQKVIRVKNKNKSIRKDNLSACRRKLIEYCTNNEKRFTTFVTLTFKDNICSISEANKKFNSFLTQCRRNFKEFCYLGVLEFQKRGAVHYHILTNATLDNLIEKQENKENCYNFKYWIYGFSSVFFLENTDDKFNTSLYICKYLYKDMDNRLFGHKKIYKSNNIKLPNEQLLLENSDSYKQAIEYIEKNYKLTDEYTFKNFYNEYTYKDT